MGWLFSFAVTRWGLHGHPLRARTLHVSPYLQCRPWRLQLRVHAEDFGFGNPPGDRRRQSRTCSPVLSRPAAPCITAGSPTRPTLQPRVWQATRNQTSPSP